MSQEQFPAQLWKSITSANFYQAVAQRRFSEGVKYFSFLILFVALLLSVRFSFDLFQGLSTFEGWSHRHLPNITIEKGKVSVDVPQPWQKKEGEFVIIIDTTGQTNEVSDAYPQGILLTQDQLFLKRNPYETRRYDLSKVDSFHFNSETVKGWRKIGQWVLPPFLFFFLFVYFWIGKFSQVLFFSGISLLTNWIARKDLPYRSLLTIGMYAITPPLLLFCAITLSGLRVRFFDMIYLSSYAALLVTVILQCPPQPKTDDMSKGPWS